MCRILIVRRTNISERSYNTEQSERGQDFKKASIQYNQHILLVVLVLKFGIINKWLRIQSNQ